MSGEEVSTPCVAALAAPSRTRQPAPRAQCVARQPPVDADAQAEAEPGRPFPHEHRGEVKPTCEQPHEAGLSGSAAAPPPVASRRAADADAPAEAERPRQPRWPPSPTVANNVEMMQRTYYLARIAELEQALSEASPSHPLLDEIGTPKIVL